MPAHARSPLRFLLASRWFLAVVAALWAASLALPAVDAGGRTFDGLEVLLRGWEGLDRGIYAWLANPLFGAALAAALASREIAAAVLSLAALALGASSVMTEEWLRASMSSVPPIQFRAGFYVWLAAVLALCLHSLTLAARKRVRRGEIGKQ